MWWLLLVWMGGEVYTAHSVYATVEQCAVHQQEGDWCVQVELNFVESEE